MSAAYDSAVHSVSARSAWWRYESGNQTAGRRVREADRCRGGIAQWRVGRVHQARIEEGVKRFEDRARQR